MGKVIAKKISGMNIWAKGALTVLFTFALSVFMYHGWYKPLELRAATTSANYAGTGSQSGSGWSNISNAVGSSSGNYATYSGTSQSWLRLTNFGFTTSDIPSGATINGITVTVRGRNSQGSQSMNVALTKNGTTALGSKTFTISSSYSNNVQGSSSDLWGQTWTDTDLTSSSFGVMLRDSNTTASGTFEIDYVTVVVTYTAGNTTTLGNGVTITTTTVCPGTTGQKLDGFSFVTSSGTDSITALTVTTTNYAAIANISIWDEAGTTQYFSTVSNPTSNTINFSGGTAVPVSATTGNFKVVVDYDPHGSAPTGNTATTAYVSAFTSGNTQAGTDSADATVTLDNSAATAAAWGTNSGGVGQVTLNWTLGTTGDSVMIARYPANSDTTLPTDGTVYTVSSAYGTGGTVVYVGTGTTYTDTVAAGTYYYRIFEYDGCLNYATTAPWSAALASTSSNPTTAGTATAAAASATTISVSMPYSGDANSNSTYTVDYKLSASGTWTNWVTNAAHTASPYTTTITGLTSGSSYDVRMTYNDADGVTGTNPQTVSGIVLPSNATATGAMTFTGVTNTSMTVNAAFTGDANGNNTCVIKWGTVSGSYPNTATSSKAGNSYTATISGLTANTTYYFQATFSDADTVTGTNPVLGSQTTLSSVWTNNPLLHNSTNMGSTKWGANGWGIPNGKYGAFVCSTCHQSHAPNIKRINGSISPPDGFSIWSSNSASSVAVSFQNVTSMGHDNRTPGTSSANVCEVCHSRNKYHNYNVAKNTGGTSHNNGLDCTSCHSHKLAFKASESGGNSDCSGCHNDIYGQLNGSTSTYHHYMQNAAVTTLGSGSKYPNTATLTTSDTNRRCLMCHVDHDIFRSDLNGANGGARGKNLRTDATALPTTTANFTRKDFDNGLTNGGICTSCHLNEQTKNTTNQKSDSTTVTLIVNKANFAASMHNYSTNSTAFGDGSKMNANCVKCHDAQNAEASAKTSFGTHDNTARRLVTALGGTLTDPYEDQFCYRCHSKITDAVGGTVKPAAGRDYYNAATMSAAAEDTFTAFNGKANGHKPGSYSGIHKPTTTDETFAYISANKHVECNDCHAPHAAGKNDHTTATNTIAANSPLSGATGVATPTWPALWTAPTQSAYGTAPTTATTEWQVCFKCHSGANSSVTSWGGTGAAAWTDLGLEFNPNNNSSHPVVQALPSTGNRRLASTALTGGWTPGGVMTCSDCHGTDSTASKGPHGSSVKWMLNPNTTGTKYSDWPYTSATFNGTSTGGTLITSTGSTTAPNSGQIFCLSCHVWSGGGEAHTRSDHANISCVGCHIRVPHGAKTYRLITGPNAPARYKPDGNGGGTTYLNGITLPASGNVGSSNCNTSGGCTEHTASGAVTW